MFFVERNPDELNKKVWAFNFSENSGRVLVRLARYKEEYRPTRRHNYRMIQKYDFYDR